MITLLFSICAPPSPLATSTSHAHPELVSLLVLPVGQDHQMGDEVSMAVALQLAQCVCLQGWGSSASAWQHGTYHSGWGSQTPPLTVV